MRKNLWFLAWVWPNLLFAADLDNGAQLHKKCALCHGQWSQGIPGGLYPRLAGLPETYLRQQIEDYRQGRRKDNAMVVIGGLVNMPESDLTDLIAYIASIDLAQRMRFNIPTAEGYVRGGAQIYRRQCEACHGSHGEGSPHKGTPPLAGQYTEYLRKQIKDFSENTRNHGTDTGDNELGIATAEALQNLLAYLSTLDDGR